MQHLFTLCSTSLLLSALFSAQATAADWPTEAQWEAVPFRDGPAQDACGDARGGDWWDIVGDATRPAASVFDDGESLWFRLRLADVPYTTTGGDNIQGWRSAGWGVLLEVDWDTTDVKYDFLLLLDGAGEAVVFWENREGSDPFSSDPAEDEISTEDAPIAGAGTPEVGAAGYAASDSQICTENTGAIESFIVWRIAWAELTARTGATRVEALGLLFGSSTASERLSKDIVACDSDAGDSDDYWQQLSRYDADGDGLDNVEEVTEHGTDPFDADTDGGGVSDGDEVEGGTDPLDAADDAPPDTGEVPPDIEISGAIEQPIGRYFGGCLLSSRLSLATVLLLGLAGGGIRRRSPWPRTSRSLR